MINTIDSGKNVVSVNERVIATINVRVTNNQIKSPKFKSGDTDAPNKDLKSVASSKLYDSETRIAAAAASSNQNEYYSKAKISRKERIEGL